MIIRYLFISFVISFINLSFTYTFEIQAQKIKFIKQQLPGEIKSINDIKVEGNYLWVATGQGLYKCKRNKIFRYYDENYPEKLMVNTIEIDDSDNKWLSNYAGNLIKFNKGKIQKEINFIGLIDNRSDILTDIEIYKDKSQKKDEILLTSSNGLILYYNPKIDQIGLKRSPVKNMIYSVHYGVNDILWLCSAEGFYTKNKDKSWKINEEMYQGYAIVKEGNKYWGVGRNKDNEAVFMLYYNGDDNKKSSKYVWKQFDLMKLKNKYIRFYDIGISSEELVWIASNEGLVKYNPLTGSLKIYNNKNTKKFDLKDVRHIAVQDENSIWVSSGGSGLYKLVVK